MARQTKENAQDTYDKILSAAAYLFSSKSYYCTSLEDIAKQATVTRGAIYWHFKNKADIFNILHERLHLSFVEMISDDLAKDHPCRLTQLQDLCIRLLVELDDDLEKRGLLTLFLLRSSYAGDLAVYKEPHHAKKREHVKLFSQYFDKIKAQGAPEYLQDIDSDVLALSLSCYIKGIFGEYIDNPNDFTMEGHAPALVKLFFHTLKA